MKTKEELAALKREYEALREKLKDLSEEELLQVTGGADGTDGTGHGKVYDGDILP